MSDKQDKFDAKITSANEKLDKIAESVTAESKQIADYIKDNPDVDTSALDGVVARLEQAAGSVSGIFEPTTETPANPETPEA